MPATAGRSCVGLALELAARVREVQTLEAQAVQTAAALKRERAGRVAYLASLARQQRLTKRQIRALDSRARQVVVKAQQVQAQSSPGSSTAPAAAPWVVAGPRTLTVTSTGYSMKGRTATGLPVGLGIVAVDPSVIPLGTRLTIPGYGEGIAADTGGAVQGMTIDLWFPTLDRSHGLGPAHGHGHAPLNFAPPAAGEETPSMSEPVIAGEQTLADVRVLIVDDHDLFRSGLRNLLEDEGVQVVGEAAAGQEALNIVRELAPDVVVMDLNMPGHGRRRGDTAHLDDRTAHACRDADDLRPGQRRDRRHPRGCLRLSPQGLVDSGADRRDPRRVPRRVADLADDRVEGVCSGCARRAHSRRSRATIRAELSEREIEVLKLIANGKDNAMIAGELHISPKTVKNHISNILMKLQIDNRIQAAVYAVRSGIV